MKSPNLIWGLIALAVVGYLLPWVVNPGLSLSLGAYDLAEWISLRIPNRPLESMLLLRLPPLCLAGLIVFSWERQRFSLNWWLALFYAALTAIALLPPIEFFTMFRDDVNYSQQFYLAIGTLLLGILGLSGLFYRFRRLVIAIVGLIAIASSVFGLTQAMAIMQVFQLPVRLGMGSVILAGLVGIVIVLQLAPYPPFNPKGDG